jgi:hypothetical protein
VLAQAEARARRRSFWFNFFKRVLRISSAFEKSLMFSWVSDRGSPPPSAPLQRQLSEEEKTAVRREQMQSYGKSKQGVRNKQRALRNKTKSAPVRAQRDNSRHTEEETNPLTETKGLRRKMSARGKELLEEMRQNVNERDENVPNYMRSTAHTRNKHTAPTAKVRLAPGSTRSAGHSKPLPGTTKIFSLSSALLPNLSCLVVFTQLIRIPQYSLSLNIPPPCTFREPCSKIHAEHRKL